MSSTVERLRETGRETLIEIATVQARTIEQQTALLREAVGLLRECDEFVPADKVELADRMACVIAKAGL